MAVESWTCPHRRRRTKLIHLSYTTGVLKIAQRPTPSLWEFVITDQEDRKHIVPSNSQSTIEAMCGPRASAFDRRPRRL
jgi:hypothetical protein